MAKCFIDRPLVTGVLIAASLPMAQQADAQADAQASAFGLEEIVVTARRREESLRDVPIAVTAVTAEALALRGAPDITDLQRSTPSLTLQVARGTNSTLTSFIRGVGQQDPLWGFEPGVGLYVDDVYYARPQGAVLDILDVERIEVLRGPQGTLYGRNTIGGAIKYVTPRLDSQQRLRARAEVGTDGERNAVLSGSSPVSDSVSIGAAIGTFNRDGFGRNLETGADHGLAKDVVTGRVTVEWTPGDAWFLRFAYDRLQDDSNPYHGHREAPAFVVPGANGATIPPSGGQILPGKFDTNAGLTDSNRVQTEGYSLHAQWDASETITLKSITAYRDGRSDGGGGTDAFGIDFDGTPSHTLDVGALSGASATAGYEDRQFSQELQLALNAERWQGLFGLYYFDATASGAFDTIAQFAVPAPLGGFTQGTSGRVDTRSYAVFADLSFDLSQRWSASIGGRWTRDDKEGAVFKANYLGLGSPISGRNAAPIATLTDYRRSRSFDELTPRVSATWKVASDVNLYASYSRGFKSGGFDMRGDALAYPATVEGYEPEIVDAYELGLKGLLANGRLNLALALFDQQYQDQQVTTQYPGPPTSPVVSVVDNAGKSRIRGAELEASVELTRALSAQLGASYLDAEFIEYQAFVPGTGLIDVADSRSIQNTPKWMGFLGLSHEWQLGSAGTLTLSGSGSYRDDVNMFETPVPLIDQRAYWLYDASAVWTSASRSWRIGVYGRNLSDESYRTGGYNFASVASNPATWFFGNSVIGFYGPPRTVKAALEYRF